MPGKTRCFLPSISLLTSLIFLQRKRCNLSERTLSCDDSTKEELLEVKKDFKTFVFDVGITASAMNGNLLCSRQKYQSQMLPTAWFCPLFFHLGGKWQQRVESLARGVLRKRENSPPRKMTHRGKKSRSTLTCNYAPPERQDWNVQNSKQYWTSAW